MKTTLPAPPMYLLLLYFTCCTFAVNRWLVAVGDTWKVVHLISHAIHQQRKNIAHRPKMTYRRTVHSRLLGVVGNPPSSRLSVAAEVGK